MKFGAVNITIAEDGELTIARDGLALGDSSGRTDADLLRASRWLVRYCRAVADRRGGRARDGYLHAVCEPHTFTSFSRLGRATGARINNKLRVVSWKSSGVGNREIHYKSALARPGES